MGLLKKKKEEKQHASSIDTIEMLIRLEGVTRRLETLADVLETADQTAEKEESDEQGK